MDPDKRRTWEHTLEMVVLLFCCAFAGVAVLPGTRVPGWTLPALIIVAGLTACLAIWQVSGRGSLAAYALFFGLFLGGWTIGAEAVRVWNAVIITVWLGGMIVFAPWGAAAVTASRRASLTAVEASPDDDPAVEHQKEMRRFETMFAEAGQAGVTVLDLSESRSGRILRLALPDHGKVTVAGLQGSIGTFEVRLRAQPGAIEIKAGAHAGEAVMRIRERYALREIRALARELMATTVNEPFAIGIQEDGSTLKISIRELHMFIVGTTGAGKSNLLNVITAQLASCVDTIIWVIDMKGGRTARPWLQAWSEGNAEAPAIDWVATTREEAAVMMQAFLLAIETRMNSGIGGSKITPSASIPQIILICDETADLLGVMRGRRAQVGEEGTTNTQFGEWAETIAQKGRSEAGSSIWATQRGTNDMAGSGTLRSLCKLRIALGASTEGDIRYVIPDARDAQKLIATMEDIPGVGIAAVRKQASMLTKFFLCDHIEGQCSEGDNNGCVPACPVYRASIEVAPRRPRLDKMTASALGDAYSQRWLEKRAGHLVRSHGNAAAAVADIDTSDFEQIMHQGGVEDPESGVNPIQVRYREILAARGSQGATPKYLMDRLQIEGHVLARETLQRWLRKDETAGLVHQADYRSWKIGTDTALGTAA